MQAQAKSRYFALIPAGGTGNRMGASYPKQYLPLGDKPILQYVVDAFFACPEITGIFIVVNKNDHWIDKHISISSPERVQILRCGGETRRDTVLSGLEEISANLTSNDWVMVHDAARPGLTPALIRKLIDEVGEYDAGGLLALPVVDTVKRQVPEQVETISREGLWLAQTPQMFRYGMLKKALEANAQVTDEASAIEASGRIPKLVKGHLRNSKITQPSDLELVKLFLENEESSQVNKMPFRIGQGYDCHALVPDRELIIGGVHIPHKTGLSGHSDADVLLHAITDALLGAAKLGDIGRHFPDTDERFKGADSRTLLREAMSLVRSTGYEVGNLDATIIAQAPKMAEHIPLMVRHIADDLGTDVNCVNIKAKTNEKLGYLGREEGIAAEAVVLLVRTTA